MIRSVLRRAATVLVVLVMSAGVVGATAVVSSADTPPTPGLSVSFTLKRHTVVSGGTVKGTVTARNDTGAPVMAKGCGGWFSVLLDRPGVRTQPVGLACLTPIEIPVGTSTYPVTVRASARGCATAAACVEGPPPPLTPGKYEARFYQATPTVAEPKPVKVKVTAP